MPGGAATRGRGGGNGIPQESPGAAGGTRPVEDRPGALPLDPGKGNAFAILDLSHGVRGLPAPAGLGAEPQPVLLRDSFSASQSTTRRGRSPSIRMSIRRSALACQPGLVLP